MKTQSLSLQIAKTDLNHKLQLLASEYQQQSLGGVAKFSKKTPMLESNFHLDNLLFIFLRFLLVTLSMYLFAGKARKNNCCCLNPLNTLRSKQILTQS